MNRILEFVSNETETKPQSAGPVETVDDSELLDAYSHAVTKVVRAVASQPGRQPRLEDDQQQGEPVERHRNGIVTSRAGSDGLGMEFFVSVHHALRIVLAPAPLREARFQVMTGTAAILFPMHTQCTGGTPQ